MRMEYFIVLGLIVVFPLILSRDPKLGLYRHRKALWFAVIGMCIPFWLWDVVAAARGHWWYSGSYTIGVEWLGLPLEEWLFFPIVGFVSIFTWESTKYFRGRKKHQ
jgi:lycopene cyclase domain-containing protein